MLLSLSSSCQLCGGMGETAVSPFGNYMSQLVLTSSKFVTHDKQADEIKREFKPQTKVGKLSGRYDGT